MIFRITNKSPIRTCVAHLTLPTLYLEPGEVVELDFPEFCEYKPNIDTMIKEGILDIVMDGSGGGPPDVWTNPKLTTATVGGLNAGAALYGLSAIKILEKILYKYMDPAFTSAAISTFSSPKEIGDTVAGNGKLTFSISNASNVKPESLTLVNHTGDLIADKFTSSPQNLSFVPWSRQTVGTTSWILKGMNTENGSFQTSINIQWQALIFFGVSEDTELADEAAVKALAGQRLASSKANEFDWTAPGYKYIAFPASFGRPSSITDTGRTGGIAGAIAPFNQCKSVDITNQFGITMTYQVWRSANRLGGKLSVKVS